jgi:PAS domain S-box-containing protein
VNEKGREVFESEIRGQAGLTGMFESLLDNASMGVALYDRDLRFIYINTALADINGVLIPNTLGKRPRDILPTIGREVESLLHRVIQNGETLKDVEISGTTQAALQRRHWLATYCPLRSDRNEIIGAGVIVKEITDRKNAEDALLNSQQMLQNILLSFPGVVFWKDRQSVYLGGNKAFAEAAGVADSSQLPGKTDHDMPWAKTEADAYRADDREVIDSGIAKIGIIETQYRADGNVVWYDTSKVPLKDASGNIIGVLGTAHDITKERTINEQLRGTAFELASIFRALPDLYFKMGIDGTILDYKTGYIKSLYVVPEEFLGKKMQDVLPRQVGRQFAEALDLISGGREQVVIEYALPLPEGLRDFECRMVPLEKDQVVAFIRDITDQKRAAEELKRSEARYRTLFESASDAIFVSRLDKWVECNDAAVKMFGCSRDELLKSTPSRFSPPLQDDGLDSREKVNQQVAAVLAGTPKAFEWKHRRLDGTLFDAEVSLNRMEYLGETMVLAIVRDISARKEAEKSLRESRQMLQTVLDTIPVGVFWKDLNSIFLGCNKLSATNGGLANPAEIVGKTDYEMPWREFADDYCRDDKNVMESGMARLGYEEFLTAIDGRRIVLRTNKIPLRDSQGTIIGVLGSYEDITEYKRTQETREHLTNELQRKNEELESILYVASHDLRSALVNVQGFSHELEESYKIILERCDRMQLDKESSYALKEAIPEALGFIISSITKIDSILTGLLRLSRLGRQSPVINRLDMNELAASVIASLQYKLRTSEASVTAENLPACRGDSTLIDQVFSNLIDNAIKYRDPARQLQIKISGAIRNSCSVYCVEDNGTGIAEQHQEKIFEPFHRLEPEKTAGEGIGLSIVKRIVEMHNGAVWVESKCGEGSRFYVKLPGGRQQ